MDPINQNGTQADAGASGTQPINPSMPPIQEPPKPAEAAAEPEAPLETEVNQFKAAEPAAPAQSTPAEIPPQVAPAPEAPVVANPTPPPADPISAEPQIISTPTTESLNPPPAEPVMPQFNSVPAENIEPATVSSPMAEPTPPEVVPQAPVAQPPLSPPPMDQIGTLDQNNTPNQQQTSAPLQTPPVAKKSKVGLIIIIVVIVLALAAGGYYYFTKMQSNTATDNLYSTEAVVEETVPTPENANTIAGSEITAIYDKAVAISATADKAQVVDTVLAPILSKTFSTYVKLTDATSMLTYVVNRAITASDITSVKNQLETQGYKSVDSTAKQLTVAKTGSTWVISFSIDSQTKAQIDVTY